MEITNQIRSRVRRKINDESIRDKVLTGYDQSAGLFWLAAVDSRGEIDQAFAERMPPESYPEMVEYLGRLARQRGAETDPPIAGMAAAGRLQ